MALTDLDPWEVELYDKLRKTPVEPVDWDNRFRRMRIAFDEQTVRHHQIIEIAVSLAFFLGAAVLIAVFGH